MRLSNYSTPYGTVEIPVHQGRTGVSASGGVDSTMVLYLMLLNKLHPEIFFLDKANSSLEALTKVTHYLSRLFEVDLSIITVPRDTHHHYLRPDIMKLTERVEYLYTGVTKNPPWAIQDAPGTPNRPAVNTTTNIITPFLQLDKRASIFLYKYFGLEDLLRLTFSCTQKPDVPCGDCFACREKEWAMAEVGLC